MVLDFPLDAMHCMDLGNMCNLLTKMLDLKAINLELAESMIMKIRPFIPSDFPRKIRSFNDLIHFKASEFRFFALVFGPLLFSKCCENEKMRQNFMLFFSGYRLLMGWNGVVTESDLNDAKETFDMFVFDFGDIYGEEFLTFNIHALLHITDYVKRFGPLDGFSCYKYENYYQLIRKWMRRHGAYFQQLMRRWFQNEGDVKLKSNKNNCFGMHHIKANEKDNCVLLKNGDVALIHKCSLTLNGPAYAAKTFMKKEDSFTFPFSSSRFKIFTVSDLSGQEIIFEPHDIEKKMVRLPDDNKYIVIPILHYNF